MPVINTTNRSMLISSLPHNGVVAEIGVQGGGFADTILRLCTPKLLYTIDCWEQQSIADYGHDPANVGNADHEEHYQTVLRMFEGKPNVKVMRAYSQDAARQFDDKYFDWLYFDANHLQLRADLEAWWPKVKPGGWMAGHDYCVHEDYILVKPVVDFFVVERGLTLYVTQDPPFPSWLFQKAE